MASDKSKPKGASAQSPEALARDIEQTRADLAVTLDAIADRVSPKNVARRGSAQVVATVKEKAAEAKVVLSGKAAQTKESVAEKTAPARAAVVEKTAPARAAVAERVGGGGATLSTGPLDVDELPPVAGVEVPGLAPATPTGPVSTPSTYVSTMPTVRKEVLAGVAAALLGLWLLRRSRR